MQFIGRVEIDEFNREPAVVRGHNTRYASVRYGWFVYNFLLEEGSTFTHTGVSEAIQAALAVKQLADDHTDTDLNFSLNKLCKHMDTRYPTKHNPERK